MKISPAYRYTRNVTAISDFWPPNVNEGSHKCNPEDAATLVVTAEELGEWKKQGVQGNRAGPVEPRCVRREEISEPRGLHLPTHRMLNSLT